MYINFMMLLFVIALSVRASDCNQYKLIFDKRTVSDVDLPGFSGKMVKIGSNLEVLNFTGKQSIEKIGPEDVLAEVYGYSNIEPSTSTDLYIEVYEYSNVVTSTCTYLYDVKENLYKELRWATKYETGKNGAEASCFVNLLKASVAERLKQRNQELASGVVQFIDRDLLNLHSQLEQLARQ